MTDFISAPFYDLFHEDWYVPKVGRHLSPLLAGVRRSILEVGAGTGLITTALADWTPAEIFAAEPSAAMRAVLHPLRELQSRQVGRHAYAVLTEVLDPDGEACRTRYLYRITEGDKVISEEQITGCSYHPAPNVLRQELAAAGFTQAEGADGLLAWRLA